MDKEEFDKLVQKLRDAGLSDENIAEVCMKAYLDGKCDRNDLEVMMNWLGYSLTEDFYKDNNCAK